MLMISLSDRFLWLDRMHEAQGRFRQGVGDKPHLRDGSNIEMRNSALPERLQKLRRRIRLDRIKRFARKLFSKESSSPTCSLRTNKRYRLNRLEGRSEEHTSELQSLMRISYAVFCLKKKKQPKYSQKNTIKYIPTA